MSTFTCIYAIERISYMLNYKISRNLFSWFSHIRSDNRGIQIEIIQSRVIVSFNLFSFVSSPNRFGNIKKRRVWSGVENYLNLQIKLLSLSFFLAFARSLARGPFYRSLCFWYDSFGLVAFHYFPTRGPVDFNWIHERPSVRGSNPRHFATATFLLETRRTLHFEARSVGRQHLDATLNDRPNG